MTYPELQAEWESDAIHILARTSGSTGTPREIMLPKAMVTRSALRTIDYFSISADDLLYSCISPDFIGGKMMLIRSLIAGCRFLYEPPSNKPLSLADSHLELSLLSVVPSQMMFILNELHSLPKVKKFLIGGSAISPELRQRIVETGVEAYESYGMTETASHIALRKVDTSERPFKLLPGISITADSRGCLVIDMGADGVITTNDLVEFDEENHTSFRILGRADHIIISGGKKVNPLLVEQKISPLLPGREICVTSRPDLLWTERVILLIEHPEEASTIDLSTLNDTLHTLLPPWECPKEIRLIPTLPRTASGKILRRPLP